MLALTSGKNVRAVGTVMHAGLNMPSLFVCKHGLGQQARCPKIASVLVGHGTKCTNCTKCTKSTNH